MKKIVWGFGLTAMILAAIPAQAQDTLTDQQVATAIERGRQIEPKDACVTVKESAAKKFGLGTLKSFTRTMVNPANLGTRDVSDDLEAQICTPEAHIEYQAAQARAEHRKFSIKDVSSDMRRPVIRVMVKPFAQSVVLRKNKDDDNGVAGRIANQATWQNFTGGLPTASFEFELDEVRELTTSEFIVSVSMVGMTTDGRQSSATRDFKVKREQLARLPM